MSISFGILAHTNVIILSVDDLRYNDLSLTGAPPFVSTPNLDRIGIEGVNFINAFVVYSKCKPSKGTMLTGLYPHVYDAAPSYFFDAGLSKQAKDKGYHTAFIGKYHWTQNPRPYWDHWAAYATFNPFINPSFNINGTDTTVAGHLTDIVTDFALDYLESHSANPFMLFLSYKAVHLPATPQDRFAGMFDSVDMPLPILSPNALVNKPSFIKPVCTNERLPELIETKKDMYELLTGLDECVGVILDTLESKGILDSTFIILMSDNGFMYGENRLSATKKWVYEQSMRIPMLARYPKSIPSGTVVSDFALNLDLVQTVYDVMDIDSAQTQGVSLLDFVDGSKTRKEFLYEFINNFSGGGNSQSGQADVPTFRAVRTEDYKFVDYICDQVTEELYDLQLDPEEHTNVIFDTSYTAVIGVLRQKLDSLRFVYGDTNHIDTLECSLIRENQCCLNPTNLRITPFGPTDYVLQWDTPTLAAKFYVEIHKDGNVNSPITQTTLPQIVLQNLKANSQYEWRVMASCNDTFPNESLWTDRDTFYTPPACLPSDTIYTSKITHTGVRLHWIPDPIAVGYRLFGKAVGSNKVVILNISPTDSFKNVNNLSPSTNYVWTIKTTCDQFGSVSDFSMIDTFRTLSSPVRIGSFADDANLEQELSQMDKAFDFVLMPNPSPGMFAIDFTGILEENVEVSITDILGKVVHQEAANLSAFGSKIEINLPNHSKGIHFVHVKAGQSYKMKKILIQ